jgi:PBP1b-binding outer membrane lipoprotein LpoB|tara:strand:- start:618 stop:938 length:321 start_codon:yes stop_codon:yes gene_type:complete
MKSIKSLFIICVLTILLYGCNSLTQAGKVLRGDKSSTTDEFLIKKKEPLTLPPDFETIPKPGSVENKSELKEDSFEKLLKKNQPGSGNRQIGSSSTENSILNKIKK